MTERQLKEKVIYMIRQEFPNVFFWKTSERFTSGIPDIVGCIEGRFFAIELKAARNKPSKIQDYTLKKIREAGGHGFLAYNLSQIRMFFNNFEDYTCKSHL